jgi:glycosyltransferase involved in cell wall biosynthesis
MRQGAGPGQCVVIPNGAEIDPDTVLPDGTAFRRRLGIALDAPLVLFMGRLHRIKGLDVLVDAFATVRDRFPTAQLVIAGPDEGERAAVEARARSLGLPDAVHLPGSLDGNLRLAAYSAADVFALTSWSEGMPNAVLEACASGTPVLISDQCNLPEVAAFSAGRIVPVSPAPVATALAAMLADREGLDATGANARRMVRERFAFPTVIDRLEELYDRLARPQAASTTRDAAAQAA